MQWKILVDKDELDCLVVLLQVYRMSKGQGWFEPIGTLLTPFSPKKTMGNDSHGLYCQPANRLELYKSAYCSWPFLKDMCVCMYVCVCVCVYICVCLFVCSSKCSSAKHVA